MFSYAGIYLSQADDSEMGAWIEATIRPSELFVFSHRTWPNSLNGTAILDITPENNRAVKINNFWWPWSAARFARAHFVVDDKQLDSIRQKVQQNGGGTLIAADLKWDDGTTSISASMWMLPAWPLQQVGKGANCWLLTLVDDRYWWWGVPLTLEIDEGTTLWTDLYQSVADALEINITVDQIPSAYGYPVIDYTTGYRPLPAVLDAIAWSVQQRIVRSFTGEVRAMNSAAAYNLVNSRLSTLVRPYAGGQLALLPG